MHNTYQWVQGYSASKFALEGWAEGMNIDMKQFGIHFMLLEPDGFRTDFANENALMQIPDLRERS